MRFDWIATFAYAQQADVTFGAGTLLSSSSHSASVTAVGPERGGTYINVSGDVIFKHRIGFNVEGAWRAKQGLDAFGQPYRPILVDANGVFQPRITKKVGADLMAGIGFQSTRFYGYKATSSCVNDRIDSTTADDRHDLERRPAPDRVTRDSAAPAAPCSGRRARRPARPARR